MNFIPTYLGHTADGGTNFFAIFSAMYSHVITVHYGNENSHAIKFDFFGIIAQVLSNAVGNSVNKESIAHILIQLCR